MRKQVVCLFIFILVSYHINSQSIIVNPYLQDLSTTAVKIMLETDAPDEVSIDYSTNVFDLSNTVIASSQIGNVNTRIHTATIIGLTPGTKYYYKARLSNGSLSSLYHFTTYHLQNAEQDVNLIGISDMQQDASNPSVFTNLVNQGIITVGDTAIMGGLDNLHGIIIPGDLVQTGGNYNSWKTTFFEPAQNISGVTTLYPAIGNHEYYSNGLPNYLKYFDLPINGPSGLEEQVWYKDISNVRIIALNSNSGTSELNIQLTWLDNVLNEVCANPSIDFVFAQLHHPYHSELWTPGELGFTGGVINRLEAWATNCNKVSAHYYGHTHAYSRGQSRDHQHLMVNVATAGGAIDNWGEFPNADYPEYSISQDEYGFVLIQTTAGIEPTLRIRRFGRGDQNGSANNVLRDEIVVKAQEFPPVKPKAVFPINSSQEPSCLLLRASAFDDAEDLHQASHWQLSPTCDFTSNVTNIWKQHENWYNEENTQANDNLIDEFVYNLQPNSSYCWRVRYRDGFLKWSAWSDPVSFNTTSVTTTNLLQNHDAENGIANWTGQIEALTNNECNSVPVYQGSKFFAIGGVCANESSIGTAFQIINVSSFSTEIDNQDYQIKYSAYMRTYAVNNDKPEMYLEFLNAAHTTISTTSSITTNQPVWSQFSNTITAPIGTRFIKVWLKGTRSSGVDNDSYFDVLRVEQVIADCATCAGIGTDFDGDKICSNLDCDDNNANIYPGALELCDGLDNNCDGLSDSGNFVTFTGQVDSDWHKPSNWSQNLVPLPCQSVLIPSDKTVVVSTNTDILGLNVLGNVVCNSNSVVNINSGTIGNGLSVSGTLVNHGKIIIKNAINIGIQNAGNVTNNGRIYLSNNQGNDVVVLPNGLMTNQGMIDMK